MKLSFGMVFGGFHNDSLALFLLASLVWVIVFLIVDNRVVP